MINRVYRRSALSHTHILCSLYLLCAFRDFAASSEVQIPFQSHFDKKNHQAKDTDAVDAVDGRPILQHLGYKEQAVNIWINDQPQLLSWIGPPLTIFHQPQPTPRIAKKTSTVRSTLLKVQFPDGFFYETSTSLIFFNGVLDFTVSGLGEDISNLMNQKRWLNL